MPVALPPPPAKPFRLSPTAVMPDTSVPRKQPRTTPFDTQIVIPESKPLTTRPLTVEPSDPLTNHRPASRWSFGSLTPETTIFRTALIAPVELVLAAAPVWV